jgi:2-keto-4-pentenoate hydratase/2-oxohepta-3-ene-1,7-dioic acid hydratase in catechol pathway
MRLARIAHPTGVAFVVIEGTGDGSADTDDLVAKEILDHPFGVPEFTGREWPLGQTRLLIFLKPSTSVIGPGAPILLPPSSSRVEFEGELAVVIGRPCRDVKAENAQSVILGYTVANDVTARDLQRADVQFTRGKSFDSFCPIGPWIETELDPTDVEIRTELDDEVKQDGHTSDMVHSVAAQIEFISAIMTLLPGDIILTGTPAGVGQMVAGQTVSVTVEGIGTLTNPVLDR